MKYLVSYILGNCREDLEFFNQWIEKSLLATLEPLPESEFARLSYTEAIDILKKAKESFEYPVENWGVDLQSEHERYLTEQEFKKPVIISDYPKDIKPFYMRLNDDGKTVRALDVLLPKSGLKRPG